MSQGKGERTLPCEPSPVLAVKDYEAFLREYTREEAEEVAQNLY
jgi:hypothetical protein